MRLPPSVHSEPINWAKDFLGLFQQHACRRPPSFAVSWASSDALNDRRRHQAKRPPLAKIRPGRAVPAMGAGVCKKRPHAIALFSPSAFMCQHFLDQTF
jgi:hypothetical protein